MAEGSPYIASSPEAPVIDDVSTLNPARPDLFANDTMWSVFERLRREDPVHQVRDSDYGSFWSITKWNDIMAVDTDHETFSSAGGIVLPSLEQEAETAKRPVRPSFISMDPPRHDEQRKTVSPAVAPSNLQVLGPLIRRRAGEILDALPIGEEFDWVQHVSKELTAMTLATLFAFPQEDRRLLTHWSDMFTNAPGHGPARSWAHKIEEANRCFERFTGLWNERVNADPTGDLISMLAHGEATRTMEMAEYHGNVVLLIIGGNDTTRNTISGSVYALNQNPDQYQKLRENRDLIPSMVSETIRWQTPLAHMRRTATRDIMMHDKLIRAGDKVVMWYVSGNRDEDVIDQPDRFIIDRPRSRQHMSFGFGVHRCVGNRLAELQLTIIWEEIMKRFPTIQVLREPTRTHSIFVKGYETLSVVIPTRH